MFFRKNASRKIREDVGTIGRELIILPIFTETTKLILQSLQRKVSYHAIKVKCHCNLT